MPHTSDVSLFDSAGLSRSAAETLVADTLKGAEDGELFVEKRQSESLVYDDGKLNARVSAAYRDGYYQNVPGSNGGTRGIPVQGKTETLSIDASASYALNDKMTFSLEGINLTDEPNRQYHGDLGGNRDSTYVYHHTGRQVFAGIRYKF